MSSINFVKAKYEGQYWHPLPREMARFWKGKMVEKKREGISFNF